MKSLVIIEDQIHSLQTEGYKAGVTIIPFQDVIKLGRLSHYYLLCRIGQQTGQVIKGAEIRMGKSVGQVIIQPMER